MITEPPTAEEMDNATVVEVEADDGTTIDIIVVTDDTTPEVTPEDSTTEVTVPEETTEEPVIPYDTTVVEIDANDPNSIENLLAEAEGKPVILDFQYDSCQPCQDIAPAFEKLM